MNAQAIAREFPLVGPVASCAPFGGGHINQTYLVTTVQGRRYVLQHINKTVFHDPVGLMENACGVTEHIRSKGGCALHFLQTHRGTVCHRDAQGEFWRCYEFVQGFCMDTPKCTEDFYQGALAFGQFQHQLSDYPAHSLHETIPDFHNTPVRFSQLKAAICENRAGRLDTCGPEIDFYLSQEALGSRLQTMRLAGQLPLRVTHNDTKINNVLLDTDTHKPLCVLDLDTVMPGLSAYDFGDAIRTGAVTAAEDEPDASKMKLELAMFEAFTRGFLEAAPSLTESEVEVLPLGAFTMTLECGSRFLADYLNGDVYFHVSRPEHNLHRARTQIALCRDMLAHWEEMEAIVRSIRR